MPQKFRKNRYRRNAPPRPNGAAMLIRMRFAPRMSFWQGRAFPSATVRPSPPRVAGSFFDENGLFSRVSTRAATDSATPPPYTSAPAMSASPSVVQSYPNGKLSN